MKSVSSVEISEAIVPKQAMICRRLELLLFQAFYKSHYSACLLILKAFRPNQNRSSQTPEGNPRSAVRHCRSALDCYLVPSLCECGNGISASEKAADRLTHANVNVGGPRPASPIKFNAALGLTDDGRCLTIIFFLCPAVYILNCSFWKCSLCFFPWLRD